jgi:hypothetical protein
MRSEAFLLGRIRAWTLFFIAALFVSGLTAIPLQPEVDFLVRIFGRDHPPTALGEWLRQIQSAIHEVNARWPFLGLGTDWLAFGHIVIGLGFIGLVIDPVRNKWLVTWGLLACLLVIPWAWGFGMARGISWGWRFVDSSFGVGGLVPLLLIRRDLNELKRQREEGADLR